MLIKSLKFSNSYFIGIMGMMGIAIATSSCGTQELLEAESDTLSTPQIVDVGDFGSFVDKFSERAGEMGKSISVTSLIVQWGDLSGYNNGGGAYGLCEQSAGSPPTVTIDQTRWALLDEWSREALLMHELGHCVIGRGHDDGRDTDYRPLSVMNTYLISSYDYENYYWDYIAELFG